MLDTSLIEAKIRKTVTDVCFESIVSEAFIAGLPLPEDELTDGLTQRFAQYATECLKDLGSFELLKSALESEKNPMKRNYLQSMYTLCMETATDVTARILAENKDDKGLKEAASNVTFTEGEYNRFSKAAATLTPASLTNMIQKKALDTIKEEKEAHQRDQELEQELKNAITEKPADTDDAEKETDTQEESAEVDKELGSSEDDEGNVAELETEAESPIMDDAERDENVDAPAPESDMSGSYRATRFTSATEGFGDMIRAAFGKLHIGRGPTPNIAVPGGETKVQGERSVDGAAGGTSISVDLRGVQKVTVDASYKIFASIKTIKTRDDVADFVSAIVTTTIRNLDSVPDRVEAFGARGMGGYGPNTEIDAVIFTRGTRYTVGTENVVALFKALFMRISEIQLYGAPVYAYHLDVDCKTGQWEIRTVKAPLAENVEIHMAKAEGFHTKADPNRYLLFGYYMTLVNNGAVTSESFAVYEGWLADKLATWSAKCKASSEQRAIKAAQKEEERLQAKAKSDKQRKKIDAWTKGGQKNPVLERLLKFASSRKLDSAVVASIKKAMNGESLSDVDYYNITFVSDQQDQQNNANLQNAMMMVAASNGDYSTMSNLALLQNGQNMTNQQIATGQHLMAQQAAHQAHVDAVNMHHMAMGIGPVMCSSSPEAFESYMRSIAGDNYRSKHATVFSRLQELAYESILSTTEKYTEIPFDTMSLITRQNTFGRFNSHWTKSVESMMDSIGRYAFESAGVDVPAPVKEEQLNSALLTASIIYTFFETLNSMNLYCPKLAEIKQFVDETLPIESRVELDKGEFMNLFKGIMSKAQASANKAMTVPEVDATQADLDIVREKCNAPGFESMRHDIDERIAQVQDSINARRDYLLSKQKPQESAVESATQLMRRSRDTMKFTSLAGTTVAKPNVSYTKIKIDPQGGSAYIAVECYSADNRVVGKNTIVLEGATADLSAYVQAAVEGSRLPELHKRVMITDKRSGKVLFDKNWYGR